LIPSSAATSPSAGMTGGLMAGGDVDALGDMVLRYFASDG
jgi:hypothetical protein